MPATQPERVSPEVVRELALDIAFLRRLTDESARVAPLEDALSVESIAPGETVAVEDATLRAAVRQLLVREQSLHGRWRAFNTRTRTAAVLALGVTLTLAFAWAYPSSTLSSTPISLAATLMASFIGMAAITTDAMRPLSHPAPSRRKLRFAFALALGIPLVVSFLPHPSAGLPAGEGGAFFANIGACLAVGGGVAMPVLLLALASLHRLGRGQPRSLLAAASAGLVANTVLVVHCPILSTPHQLIGHVGLLPLLLAGILAWQSLSDNPERETQQVQR